MNKNISVYEQAVVEFWALIFHDERRKSGGLLNWLGEGRVTRHSGLTRTIQGENPLDQKFVSIKASAKVDHDIVRATDINAYVGEIRRMCQSLVKQESEGLFNSLNEMFDHPSSPALTIDFKSRKEEEDDQSGD